MGIWTAASLSAALAAAVTFLIVSRISEPRDRSALLIAAAVALPLQPFILFLVRIPLHMLLGKMLGEVPVPLTLLYAPLTEEPVKWLIAFVPFIRAELRPRNAVAHALAVGCGFGIGEIWLLATQLSHLPDIAAQPVWMLGGFVTERALVCLLHGGLIAYVYQSVADGRSLWPAAFAGLLLHFLANLPIYLGSIGFLGLDAAVWQMIAVFSTIGLTVVTVAAGYRLARDKRRAG
jgi:uncharacterized membrane protein YhfC